MSMRCAQCRKVIRYPADFPEGLGGQADELALPGDLCDDCLSLETDLALALATFYNEAPLDRKLRERP